MSWIIVLPEVDRDQAARLVEQAPIEGQTGREVDAQRSLAARALREAALAVEGPRVTVTITGHTRRGVEDTVERESLSILIEEMR